MRIAVTGATGYIGGRLVPRLVAGGHEVACLVRNPTKLADRPWSDRVTTHRVDLVRSEGLTSALAGCEVAFYLVHSMASGPEFSAIDRRAAQAFGEAAAAAGVKRIVYLGGLGSEHEDLSDHLASRHEVGRFLASAGVPVTEFRAAVIIGSGSVSFEMLRYLTQVLPVMTTPKWVRTRCQPIGIEDVLRYLDAAINDTTTGHRIVEIGGPDTPTYEEMMHVYARIAGLPRRLIVPVPLLSPGLSSLWIGLVTPLPVDIAKALVDSLRHEVVVSDPGPSRAYGIVPMQFEDAVRSAVETADGLRAPTRWSDAEASPALPMSADPEWSGGTVFVDSKTVVVDAPKGDVFWAFSRIGGSVGYYTHDWAWRLRGLLDVLVGGVGLRRGRRHPTEVRTGDAVDFWRVADVTSGARLELHAEMRLPGRAWLSWEVEEAAEGSVLCQTATFRPSGLAGRLYWYALLPFHALIFGRMARKIARAAELRTVQPQT